MNNTSDFSQSDSLLRDRIARFKDRIQTDEPRVRAWVWTISERKILEDASTRPVGETSPLGSTLFGVKDIIDVAGMPTRYGSRAYEHATVAPADAACVALLRQAGAIPVGKTVTAELAYAQPGLTRNPWNPEHTPGGSSSGSAAAVAAGMVPFALGTQTGGSVIRPAAYCGVVGFKASRGAVSMSGIKPVSESFDSLGWFTRSVRDAINIGRVLMEEDLCSYDFTGIPKLGVLTQVGPTTVDGESAEALSGVVQLLERSGIHPKWVQLPINTEQLHILQRKIMTHEMYRNFAYERLHAADRLGKLTLAAIREGQAVTTTEYVRSLNQLRLITARATDEIIRFDALLTYSAPGPAPKGHTHTGESSCNRVWSALGCPALHLPTGLSNNGLPIGVQLVAMPWSDLRLLEIGQQIERLINWRAQ